MSPLLLVGEGSSAVQQNGLGEGGRPHPSPNRVCRSLGAALSREGEGAITSAAKSGERRQHQITDDKHPRGDAGGVDRQPAVTAWPVGPRLAIGPDHGGFKLG